MEVTKQPKTTGSYYRSCKDKTKGRTYLDYLWKSDYTKRTKVYYTKYYKDVVKYEHENV